MQTDSAQRLSRVFVDRFDRLLSLWSSGSGADQEFRQPLGGLHDAASLLGLDELARQSMDLLDQGAGDVQALREWLPSAGLIETRLAGIATAAHTSYPEFYAEPTLVVLTADPDPHFPPRELAVDLGDRAMVVDTPVAAVTEVSARPDAFIIVAVDEATLAEDAVEYLGRELRPALRAGRLGMLLISEQTEFDRLRRARRAGFAAVEPRGASVAVLERRIELVAARCCAEGTALRALLVDSDELTRTACSALLTTANIHSTALQTIDHLPAVLADSSPDLVIISGDLDGVPGDETADLVQMYGFDPEFSTAFLARSADSIDRSDPSYSPGVELILPKNGGAPFVQRVLWRASCGRIHALENSSLTRRIARLEKVVSAMNQHALVSETDGNGVIRHVNEKFCEVSGFSREELIGHDHRVTNSGMTPEVLADMRRTISRGDIWHGSICNRARDGHLYWVKTTIVPFSDDNTDRYRYYSVRTDITYLKEVEKTLSLRGQAIEAATNGITLADMSQPDCPLVEANSAFERMTGYSCNEVVGLNCRFLQGVNTDGSKVAEIGEAIAEARAIETILLNYRKDGTPFWNEIRLSPIFSDAGELTHYLGIQHDVTRYIEAEQAAVDANEAKSEFLSRMSHELRTPLNAVVGFAQLLSTEDALSDDQRRNAEEIVSAGRHLVELVDEVLDLSRIEHGHLEVKPVVVDLGPLLDSCLSQVQAHANARAVVLQWDGHAGRVLADLTRLREVLLNLLSNAIKYNCEGGRVRVTSGPGASGRIRVSVSDSGQGITPESQARLFRPFERLESAYSDIEGTGIGLALTKRLVDAMDGAIGIDSEPGVGSTFWFELPAVEAADAADVGPD